MCCAQFWKKAHLGSNRPLWDTDIESSPLGFSPEECCIWWTLGSEPEDGTFLFKCVSVSQIQ